MDIERRHNLDSNQNLRFTEEGIAPYVGYAALLDTLGDSGEVIAEHFILSRQAYDTITEQRGMRKMVATRVWAGAAATIRTMHYHTAKVLQHTVPNHIAQAETFESIDLWELLSALRVVEAGEMRTGYSYGKVGWNLFAEIINENLAENDPGVLVLPFDGTIHPFLYADTDTDYSISKSAQAVADLESEYKRVDYEAAKLRKQISLF